LRSGHVGGHRDRAGCAGRRHELRTGHAGGRPRLLAQGATAADFLLDLLEPRQIGRRWRALARQIGRHTPGGGHCRRRRSLHDSGRALERKRQGFVMILDRDIFMPGIVALDREAVHRVVQLDPDRPVGCGIEDAEILVSFLLGHRTKLQRVDGPTARRRIGPGQAKRRILQQPIETVRSVAGAS
jgi:hypothetical protein